MLCADERSDGDLTAMYDTAGSSFSLLILSLTASYLSEPSHCDDRSSAVYLSTAVEYGVRDQSTSLSTVTDATTSTPHELSPMSTSLVADEQQPQSVRRSHLQQLTGKDAKQWQR